MGTRALHTQRAGVEVAGQNLANVNNPGYARQRLIVQSDLSIQTSVGPQGTGVDVVAIEQVRNALLDRQIQTETTVGGYWQEQQRGLQDAQVSLGEQIDQQRQSNAGDTGAGTAGGLLDSLSNLFKSFSAVAAAPASLADRQGLVAKAQQLASQFKFVDDRLDNVQQSLDQTLQSSVDRANQLIGQIQKSNEQIYRLEVGGVVANDVRDLREQRLEELAALVNFDTAEAADGTVSLATGGVLLLDGLKQVDQYQTFRDGAGKLMVQTSATGAPLALTGGRMQGAIDARDGGVTALRSGLNDVAATLIGEVNAIYVTGYDLNGGTGELFFQGSDAGDIQVNQVLLTDPSRLQAAEVAGTPGDNRVVQRMAALMDQPQASLQGQTITGRYVRIVSGIGEQVATTTQQLENQDAVAKLLHSQRDAVSGVSLDEEMTDLMRYQKAFEASARLISTVDEMLDTVMRM